MLDLEAGVDLEEVELERGDIEDVFDRAGGLVADGGGEALRGAEELGAELGREAGRGGFLDDLLVAALGGAVALAEGDDVAFAVAENLHLDVAGDADVFFEEDAALFEGGGGHAFDGFEGLDEFGFVLENLHADAAAAGGALEHDGVADAGGLGEGGGEVGQEFGTGKHGHAVGVGEGAGGVLEAEVAHLLRSRADEHEALAGAGLGEVGVFGEEAVAGVDGLRAGLAGGGEDFFEVEVALGGGAGADVHGDVGLGDVERTGVGLGVDGDGADAEFLESADDAAGDGAAVGDEDGVEHREKNFC